MNELTISIIVVSVLFGPILLSLLYVSCSDCTGCDPLRMNRRCSRFLDRVYGRIWYLLCCRCCRRKSRVPMEEMDIECSAQPKAKVAQS